MSHDGSIDEICQDLDRMMRTTVMMLGQVMERRARRRAEVDRDTAGTARQGWVDARDSARKTFVPLTFGQRAEQADPRELAAAWRAAHSWASTDPVAAAAAEHLQAQWENLYPDRDPALVGVALTPENARNLADQHAPEFYRRHILTEGEQPDREDEQQLVVDWQHWAEHGQLPRETVLREHASWLGHDLATAGDEAVKAWKQDNFAPEAPGSDGTAVIVVPADRAPEMAQIRHAAELEIAQKTWADAGRAPLPGDLNIRGAESGSRRDIRLPQARELAGKHAPDFYTRHHTERLYNPARAADPDADTRSRPQSLRHKDAAQLRADWQHWADHGRLPRESLLSEHTRHAGQEGAVADAVSQAEDQWLREQFPSEAEEKPADAQLQAAVVDDGMVTHRREVWAKYENVTIPEYRGRTSTGVIVPRSQAGGLEQARRAAMLTAHERVWADAGRDPLPPDPGQTVTVDQARALAAQHGPAYYSPERITDEQLVADWTSWLHNDRQLPREAVRRQWAAQLDREEEVSEAADAAEATLREQVPDANPDQVELVRVGAANEKLEELWAASTHIDVEHAEILAEQHAPAWYTAPNSATLREDWQAYVSTGELPLARQQEAWATWSGHGPEITPEAWTTASGGLDEEGRNERLQQLWDEGRDERAALEYAAAVAGAEAAAADLAETQGQDAAAWSRVASTLGEQGPDATDLMGDAEHARNIYAPLLDPETFAQADPAAAGRAWLAASVWASEDPPAQAAAEQLGQQFRVRFGLDPSTGETLEGAATPAAAADPETGPVEAANPGQLPPGRGGPAEPGSGRAGDRPRQQAIGAADCR